MIDRRRFINTSLAGTGALTLGTLDVKASQDQPSTIMAIAAHPADAVFAMGAQVAKHVSQGWNGVFVSLSLGELGSLELTPEQYGAQNQNALKEAAEGLDCKWEVLPFKDAKIPLGDDSSFAVGDVIRKYKPDVILTHWKGSWHKDHHRCALIVFDAIFLAGWPPIERDLPAHGVSRLYYCENWEDMDEFKPDTYLDVTDVHDKWVSACEKFHIWANASFRYDDYYLAMATVRGTLGSAEKAVALMSSPDHRNERRPLL